MLSKKTLTARRFIRLVMKPSSKLSTWTRSPLFLWQDSSAQISRLEIQSLPLSIWLRHMLTHHPRAYQFIALEKASAMFSRRISTTKTKRWIFWPSSTCLRNLRRTLLELIQKKQSKEFSWISAKNVFPMDTPTTACWDTGSYLDRVKHGSTQTLL